jgi:hypothetical protein
MIKIAEGQNLDLQKQKRLLEDQVRIMGKEEGGAEGGAEGEGEEGGRRGGRVNV